MSLELEKELEQIEDEFVLIRDVKGKQDLIASSDDREELETYISVRSKMPIKDGASFDVRDVPSSPEVEKGEGPQELSVFNFDLKENLKRITNDVTKGPSDEDSKDD